MKYWCEMALKKKQFHYLTLDYKWGEYQIELIKEQHDHLKWEEETKTKMLEAEIKRNEEMHNQKMKNYRLKEAILKRDLGMLVETPPTCANTGKEESNDIFKKGSLKVTCTNSFSEVTR